MQLLSTLVAVACIASLAVATPAAPKKFRLKTQVTEGRKDLDNNYLGHLPAGREGTKGFHKTTPILIGTHPGGSAVFHFLGTQVLTEVKGVQYGIITFYPDDDTAAFSTVQIDENSSESAFKILDGKLINFDNDNTYGNWVACFWDHAVPELFEVLGARETASYLPPNCARVDLLTEYV